MRVLSRDSIASRPADAWIRDSWLLPPLLRFIDAPVLVLALGLAVLVGGFHVYSHALTANDISWLLFAAEKYLDGAKLYENVVDTNPPLIIYLNIPPVWLGRLLGYPQAFLFVVYVFGLTILSTALVLLVTDGATSGRRAHQGRILTLAALAGLVVLPTTDFGQREHLLLVFCLPYLFLTIRRAQKRSINTGLALFVGAFAALGLALKPHFLLLPLILEAYLWLRLRRLRLRPEALAAVLVIAVYALSVPLTVPIYFERIIPYALIAYDAGFNNSLRDVLLGWQGMLLAALIALRLVMPGAPRQCVAFDVFLLSAIALFSAHVLQMKTFYYHVLPATMMLLLGLVAMAVAPGLRRQYSGALAATATIAIAAILAASLNRGTYRNPIAEPIREAMRAYATGSSVFVFSSYIWVGFPMTREADTRWPSRFPHLWILPGAERQLQSGLARDDATRLRLKEAESYMVDAVLEDINRDPPSLVIVDGNDRRYQGLTFDYLEFFGRDQRFRDLWQNYRQVGEICVGDFGPYRLYRRIETPANSEGPESAAVPHRFDQCSQ
jgi:hypothetical protein